MDKSSSGIFASLRARSLGVAIAGALMAAWPIGSAAQCPPLPLDIVVVVDTSGSMDLEIAQVASNLNAFVAGLAFVGWDPRLILLADADRLCVPAPLGSGLCPGDQQLPAYRHIDDEIGSTNALQKIVDHYVDYSSSLRPGSKRAVIVVSDDDSDLSAAAFVNALLAADAGFGTFQAHAIAASVDAFPPLPNVCTSIGATEGAVYKSLAASRGGVFYDLCLQNFLPGFAAIAASTGAPKFCDGFESGDTGAWDSP